MENVFVSKNEGCEVPMFNVGDIVKLNIHTEVVPFTYLGVFLAYKGKTSVVPQQITHAIVGGVIRFYGSEHKKVDDEQEWDINMVQLASEENVIKYNTISK